MRDYAKVAPKQWQGNTFKALRKGDKEGLLVALFLMTSPNSNMLGLYSQPLLYMAHETGLGEEGTRKGLSRCIEAGFCAYDEDTEMVWVFEMAKYQIASELKPSDLRCKGIQKDYNALPDCPFLGEFFDRYAAVFHMTDRRGKEGATQAPYQAPTKPGTGEGEGEGEGKGDVGPSSVTGKNPETGNRNGRLCAQLRKMNIDAAPHLLQSPDWSEMLSQRTDDEILSVAEIAKAKKPGERVSLNYLLPMLRAQAQSLTGGQSHATRQGSAASNLSHFIGSSDEHPGDGGGGQEVIEGTATRC